MAKIFYIADFRAARTMTDTVGTGREKPMSASIWAKPGESGYAIAIVGMQTESDLIKNFILKNSTEGEIVKMRILGHGARGTIQMGKTAMTIVTMEWIKDFANRFAPKAIIELHSCLVAGNKGQAAFIGDAFCQTMANFTGATVIAAEQLQSADLEWAFEGPVRHYKSWSDPANMPPVGPDGRQAGVPGMPQ